MPETSIVGRVSGAQELDSRSLDGAQISMGGSRDADLPRAPASTASRPAIEPAEHAITLRQKNGGENITLVSPYPSPQ